MLGDAFAEHVGEVLYKLLRTEKPKEQYIIVILEEGQFISFDILMLLS